MKKKYWYLTFLLIFALIGVAHLQAIFVGPYGVAKDFIYQHRGLQEQLDGVYSVYLFPLGAHSLSGNHARYKLAVSGKKDKGSAHIKLIKVDDKWQVTSGFFYTDEFELSILEEDAEYKKDE